MKAKIEGKIIILPTLADELPMFDTIYIRQNSLIIFTDGDVYIEPSTTNFIKDKNLLDGYSLPVFIDEEGLTIKMKDVDFVYYPKPEDAKSILSEEAIFCGKADLSAIRTKEELFYHHSFESLFKKLVSCLDEEEYETISKFFFKLLYDKSQNEKVTIIYSCREMIQSTLDNFLGSITELDEYAEEYKDRLVEIMKFLSKLLPKKDLLTRKLAEEKLEEGLRLYMEDRKIKLKKQLYELKKKFSEAKKAEKYAIVQKLHDEINALKNELTNMQK